MACLRWKPVIATNSSRMRPFSARVPLLYRSMTAATSSSRVAMLTRLIAISPTPSRPGAFQMRQRINIREHFWRGNALAATPNSHPDRRATIEALEEALARHGRPEIFNTDQGSQFTSHDFTDVLLKA